MKEDLIKFLNEKYGFKSFREGQEKIILALLKGKSTLGILPTGTGKTLCYQFIGDYLKKTVLIVSPLISLMQDQVSQMQFQGKKKVVAISSRLNFEEKAYVLKNLKNYQFIYASPEMIRNLEVIKELQKIDLGLLVVDEAHCISQWGPDFRPDYLTLGKVRNALNSPLTLALTATATNRVQIDICKNLNISETNIVRHSINRKNIMLTVKKFDKANEKDDFLIKIVKNISKAGIIYFSSRKKADEICLRLQKERLKVATYHAKMSLRDRYAVQQQFLANDLDLICATSAFGMGINKLNIRHVIHYHMPSTLEEYVQEIGRAGRDGLQSIAILLYRTGDENIQKLLMDNYLPIEEVKYYFENKNLLQNNQDETIQILKRFFDIGYTPEELISFWRSRKERKIDSLQKMIGYINCNTCFRNYILKYFEEKHVFHDKLCCKNLDEISLLDFLTELKLLRKVTNIEERSEQNYQDILKKLFKI